MKKIKIAVISVLCLLFLAGCGAVVAEPEPTPELTAAPTVPPTEVPTPVPSPTPAPTPTSTATPTPSPKPSPTPDPISTMSGKWFQVDNVTLKAVQPQKSFVINEDGTQTADGKTEEITWLDGAIFLPSLGTIELVNVDGVTVIRTTSGTITYARQEDLR